MFCTQCGNANGPAAKFCTNCGQALQVAASAVAEAPATAAAAAPTEVLSSVEGDDSNDPYKPAGMSHAEYAYSGLPSDTGKAELSKGAIAGIIVAVLVVVIGGIGIASVAINAAKQQSIASSDQSYDSGTDSTYDSGTDIATDTYSDWPPTGFTDWDGSRAYQWTTDSTSSDCSGCTYSTMDVTTNVSCTDLYVEVNFLDDAGNVVDWGNDTAPALSAGQTAKLEFDSYDDSAASTEVTDISCY